MLSSPRSAGLLLFALILVLFTESVTSAEEKQLSQTAISVIQLNAIKQGVTATLRDPASAKFGTIVRARKVGYCGYVDANNRFGERTGDRVFYADPARAVYFVVPSETEVRGLLPNELDKVEMLFPVAQANCFGAKGRPIMD